MQEATFETTPAASALSLLADAVAGEIAIGGTPEQLTGRLATVLAQALGDDGLAAAFAGRSSSFEAWSDPERGFLIHASVQVPGHHTRAHDHAESWAVYGSYRGHTAFRLFDRDDDLAPGVAALRLVRDHIAQPGDVTIVLPGQVHENRNPSTEAVAWNIVLRPRPLRELRRRRYDPETGAYAMMNASAPG